MNKRLMLLPCNKFGQPILVIIPEDYGKEEAFRFVTGVIAEVEEFQGDFDRDTVIDALEDHGFSNVDYEVGPELAP
ncbi:MAG: hypothetical protein HUJ30_07730 [Gammaproteobacteria bacterium]|nr:hypothetical protein [Gammaproteobacteria bacterium]